MTQTYAFPAPAQPFLPIIGLESVFPVRRIFCIGRNYAAHSREMGGDPTREPPFFSKKRLIRFRFVPSVKLSIIPIRP